jgi:hypothetical protein
MIEGAVKICEQGLVRRIFVFIDIAKRGERQTNMKKIILATASALLLSAGFGCASKDSVKSLEDRVSKLEQQAGLNAKRAEDAANRAEVAANKAETAAQESAKQFELMQKK